MDTNGVEWKLGPAMHCSQGATPNCLSMCHLGGTVAAPPSASVVRQHGSGEHHGFTDQQGPPDHAFTEVHAFFWALHDISVRAEHIPGASNTVADAISRNNLQVMFQEVPSASKVPDPIHPALRQLLVDQRPDWLSDNWRALLKASLPTAWQQARGRPMDPVRQAITSFAES